MLTPSQRNELEELEERIIQATKAAKTLQQKVAECNQDYDLRGTIRLNLGAVIRESTKALQALGGPP
jgi:hypothetical protein